MTGGGTADGAAGSAADGGASVEPAGGDAGAAGAESASAGSGGGAETASGASSAADSTLPSWNGELAQLRSSDWFTGLDPKVQDRLVSGIEAKYQNYERRYKPAYESNASRAKELDALEKRIKDDERRVLRLWTGEENPAAVPQAEIDKLRADHEARVAQIVEAHRAELEGAKKMSPELEAKIARMEAMEAKLAKLEKDNGELSGRLSVQEAAEQEAALSAFETWLQADAPHLIGDDADSKGFDTLIGLISSGEAPDKALQMVLSAYPPPPKATPETPPRSVAAMGQGANGATAARDTRDLATAWADLQRQAQTPWRGSSAG